MANSTISKHYKVVDFVTTTNSVGAFAFPDEEGVLIDVIFPLSLGDFFWSQYDLKSAKLYYLNGTPVASAAISGKAVFLV